MASSSAKTLGKGAVVGTTNTYDAVRDIASTPIYEQSIDYNSLLNYDKNFSNATLRERVNNPDKTKASRNLELLKAQKDIYNSSELDNIYNEIANGTFKGTATDIENALKNAKTEKANERRESTQWARDMYANQITENEQKRDGVKQISNAFGVVGNMAPTIAASAINPALGTASIYTGAYGNSLNNALDQGNDIDTSRKYATLSGALETATEMIGGEGFAKATGIPTLFGKLGLKSNNIITQTLLDIGSEGLEEVVNALIQPSIDRATINPNAKLEMEDVTSAFNESILPTILMMGVGNGTQALKNVQAKSVEKINNSNMTQEEKANAIKQINDSVTNAENQLINSQANKEVQNNTNKGNEQQNSNVELPEQNNNEVVNTENTNKEVKLEDISNLTEEDARTKEVKYNKLKDEDTTYGRKFYENVKTSNNIANEVKDRLESTTYNRQGNIDTLNKMYEKLNEKGNELIDEWNTKNIKKFTSEDVALGAILIEQYQKEGKWEAAARTVEKLADVGTEAGRAVQMYSIFQRLSPESMAIYEQKQLTQAFEDIKKNKTGEWVKKHQDEFKLTDEDVKFIYEQVEKSQQATDEETKQRELSKIESRINNKLPPEAGQTLKAWRRIAMLFNPKTQVRNVVGNGLIMPVNAVTDLIGTQIDKAIAKKTGVRTTNYTNPINIGKGFVKGIKDAYTDYKTGTRTTESGNRYEFEVGANPFNENTNSKVVNSVNKKLNWVNNLLSAIMSGGDRPFYEAAYKNSLEGQMKANKVSTPTQEMIDIAVNEALSRTWNDSNNYTKTVLGIRSAMNKLNINGFGLGDLIIPFAKTPANLTKAMVEYSPAGLIDSIIKGNDLRKAISRGEMTSQQQKNFVNSVSKAIAGTILYAIAGSMVKANKITGSKDDDKDVANFEQNVLGIQPYSIKIGDKTYTYNWANPINAPLAVMADTYKMSKEGAKKSEILLNALKVGGETLAENSFLQGIKELFSADSLVEGVFDSVASMPASLIPTLSSQIASAFDNTRRQTFEYNDEVGSFVDSIKYKIPGVRNTLSPQVNTFGEEVENQNGIFNTFLNPANVREAVTTDTQKELYSLYEATKDSTIFPRQAPYYLTSDGEKLNLSSSDRAEYQKISGQYVTNTLDALFDKEFYKSLDNESKAEIVTKIISDADTTAKDNWIDTKATEELNKKLNQLQDVPLADYYLAWYAQKNAEGQKNIKGETISGTKKKTQKEAINQATDLTKGQEEILYGIFNVK